MDRALDFTISPQFEGLGEYTQQLQENGMKLVLIFDPAICTNPYEKSNTSYPALKEALDQDLFIRLSHEGSNNDILTGTVWPAREVRSAIFIFLG